MKYNKKATMIFALIGMSFSMVYSRYKAAPLKNIRTIYKNIYDLKDESLSFTYEIFNANDCKKYFNSKSIMKKGYQPVQIKFTNNSKDHVVVSPHNFSFRCADFQDVANSLHRDGMARGIGFGLGALWFFPLLFPALIQGLGANDYNQDMDFDFEMKALKNQIVQPYTTVEGVIFGSYNEFSKNFSLMVHTVDQKKSFTLFSI
jgi:hypothetical protein